LANIKSTFYYKLTYRLSKSISKSHALLDIICAGVENQPRDMMMMRHFYNNLTHVNLSLGDAAGVACNPGPEVRALLGHGAGDGGALHLTLVVHDHPRAVLQAKKYLF
jgi:hypothetical protein